MNIKGPVVFSACFPISLVEDVNTFSEKNEGGEGWVWVRKKTYFTLSPMSSLLQDDLLHEERFEMCSFEKTFLYAKACSLMSYVDHLSWMVACHGSV